MKITLRYAELVHYKEEIEVSEENFQSAINDLRESYEEYHKEQYNSFDEFLNDCDAELLENLEINPSYSEEFIVDGNTEYLDVYFGNEDEEEKYEDEDE